MKIGLVNFTPLVYSVGTPYMEPLGGSESALCYLAEELARQGDTVRLFWRGDDKKEIRGVSHVPISMISERTFTGLDVLVIQNTPEHARELRRLLPKKANLIFWSQHASDQPPVACLEQKGHQDVFAAFVFVSQWQLSQYLDKFHLPSARCFVLRNAISPSFMSIFSSNGDILSKKAEPPVIAYTSTPFRGLRLLLDVFPKIRREVGGTTLRVYSSMKVYQGKETGEYRQLYRKCLKMPGVEYRGSLSQSDLARELPEASVLAYPNTFFETSSIAVMEAMAAGLSIVTSNAGALPETAAGFADLIDFAGDWEKYKSEFTNKVVGCLINRGSGETTQKLIRQVNFVNSCYIWKQRVFEWKMWMEDRLY